MAGSHGGKRSGAGRPKGSLSRRTLALKAAIEESGARPELFLAAMVTGDLNALVEMTKSTPEDMDRDALRAVFATQIVDLDARRKAAKDLLPYMYPKLAATSLSFEDIAALGSGRMTVQFVPDDSPGE